MKIYLALLLASMLGFGGYRTLATDAAESCAPTEDCSITLECTERGTCLVTCTAPDGRICQQEVECGDCPMTGGPDCGSPCTPQGCEPARCR